MKKLFVALTSATLALIGGSTLFSNDAEIPAGDPFLKVAAAPAPAPAPDADRPKITQVGILVEWVEMDARAANKLVRKHLTQAGPAGIPNALRNEVEKLMDADSAKLMATNFVVTRTGQRAKTESIDEVIYATEYDPPSIPNTQVLVGASQKPTAALPSSFDTRNVGATMEVDPVIGESEKLIDINIAPEWVEFVGRDYVSREGTLNEEMKDVWMPQFFTMRVSTAVVLRDGESQLISLQRPRAEGKLVLVFVQASILR